MSTNKRASRHSPPFSCFKDLEAIFGPPPVLAGEDPAVFQKLGQALWDTRPPQDFIQATWTYDIAYHLWEGNRLRRLKVKLIDSSKVAGAKRLMINLAPNKYFDQDFWQAWVLGDQETVDYVNEILSAAGLDQDAIIAQTIAAIIEPLEAIERQSAQFEARRLVTNRDLDHYSDNLDRRVELSQEQRMSVMGPRPKTTKPKKGADPSFAPQLPLDMEAAE